MTLLRNRVKQKGQVDMKKIEQGSPGMERAMKSLEQAKARYEEERRKANAKRRKAENHHKYMMGGIIVKYFPDCYECEEGELNEILSAALTTEECREAVHRIRAAADSMEVGKDGSGYAGDERTGGGRCASDGKEESGGYASIKDKTIAGGGSFGQGM